MRRDDPTFSMINESDDDDETGAMLINRGVEGSRGQPSGEESQDLIAMTSRRAGSGSLLGDDDDSD